MYAVVVVSMPLARKLAAVVCSRAAFREARTTRYPSRPNRSAVVRPMPGPLAMLTLDPIPKGTIHVACKPQVHFIFFRFSTERRTFGARVLKRSGEPWANSCRAIQARFWLRQAADVCNFFRCLRIADVLVLAHEQRIEHAWHEHVIAAPALPERKLPQPPAGGTPRRALTARRLWADSNPLQSATGATPLDS